MVRSSDELDILCTSCGRRQAGSPHLCDYCGAPLTPHASTDPVLGIMARGFAARQGITRAKKPIVVLGMWLWLGPLMLMGLVLSSMSLSAMLQAIIDGHWLEASLALLAFAVPVAMVLIPAAILVRTTATYFSDRSDFRDNAGPGAKNSEDDATSEPSKCLACGETMPDTLTKCPACGWSFSEFNE